jgi:hypothetical protein
MPIESWVAAVSEKLKLLFDNTKLRCCKRRTIHPGWCTLNYEFPPENVRRVEIVLKMY